MIRNKATGDWIKSNRNKKHLWTDKQFKGDIWNRRGDAISTINHWNLKGKVEIVEFELVELVSDPK